MKSLRHICQEAERTLGLNEYPATQLEKLAEDFIGDMKLIAYNVSIKNGNMIIVSEAEQMKHFNICRFFTAGGKWQISVDLLNGDEEKVFTYLLNKI